MLKVEMNKIPKSIQMNAKAFVDYLVDSGLADFENSVSKYNSRVNVQLKNHKIILLENNFYEIKTDIILNNKDKKSKEIFHLNTFSKEYPYCLLHQFKNAFVIYFSGSNMSLFDIRKSSTFYNQSNSNLNSIESGLKKTYLLKGFIEKFFKRSL